MVTTKKYFKAFVSCMPKRFNHIRKLKSQKNRIDKAIQESQAIAPEQCAELLELIGTDTLLRKAETRNKHTLRHVTWKISRSIELIEKNSHEGIRTEAGGVDAIAALEKKINHLNRVFDSILPGLRADLEKFDKIYREEVALLGRIQEAHADSAAVTEYLSLVKRERRALEIQGYFAEIKSYSANFSNAFQQGLRRIQEIARDEEFAEGETARHYKERGATAICLGVIATFVVFLALSLSDSGDQVLQVKDLLASFGHFLLSGIAGWAIGFGYLFEVYKLPRFMKEAMEETLI